MNTLREIDDVPEMIKAARDIQGQSQLNDRNTVSLFEAMQIACLMERNRVARENAELIADKIQALANVTEGI